ncbi:MAG: XrtA system polysaccharide deacetylase [Acidobacteriota bacterium]
MENILTIDVEDYFQVSAFESHVAREHWSRFQPRVEQNTEKVLCLLEQHKVKATFFVLGWVAERCPELVRRIQLEGHEVASHGYSHRLVYEQNVIEFREETRQSKQVLEDLIGCEVVSYRAASYSVTRDSLWALEVLAEEGFLFDSSIFPIIHDRYGIREFPRRPSRIRLRNGLKLTEVPLSTVRLWGANLPIAGGGYFRLFPYWLTKAGIQHLNAKDELPVIFYLHPWEFDPDQPSLKGPIGSRIRHYLNLKKTESRFENLLRDFAFAPLKRVVSELKTISEYGFENASRRLPSSV